jgi:hypothetical protein
MTILRAAVLLVGSFLFLLGTWKTVWEFWSWFVLSHTGQRVPLVGNDPRVRFWDYLVVSAAGLTVLICGIVLF